MTDLDQKLFEGAYGEHRLKPDEQRAYLGTFRERVVLSILVADAEKQIILTEFDRILQDLDEKYDSLTLKISPKLSLANQMFYMKKAQEAGLIATIVAEDKSDSPFGLLAHTNKAENINNPDIRTLYPLISLAEKKPDHHTKEKKSFWAKVFGD